MTWLASLGGLAGAVVVLGLAWIVTRARGLRRYRLDLHIYHHQVEQEEET